MRLGAPRKRTIYHYPLVDYTFSPDGSFLYTSYRGRTVTIDLRPFIEDESHYLSHECSRRPDKSRQYSSLELSSGGFMDLSLCSLSALPLFASLAQSKSPAVQDRNMIAVRSCNGDLEMSAIHQYEGDGEIVRRILKRGLSRTESLAFLPQSSNDANITLLNPLVDDEYVRMITTDNAKESYTFGDLKNWQLPKFIQRQKASIVETNVTSVALSQGRQFVRDYLLQ